MEGGSARMDGGNARMEGASAVKLGEEVQCGVVGGGTTSGE